MRSGVFLGIATYHRSDFLAQVLTGVHAHLIEQLDHVAICHDGPWQDVPPRAEWLEVQQTGRHSGVATVKNRLLLRALQRGAEWIILAEDDIVPQSPLAVAGYVHAAVESHVSHLMFHGHGTANVNPKGTDPTGHVTYWPNWVGAWVLYHRDMIEDVGFMDEEFVNAYDHVEHSLRIAEAGYAPLPSGPGEQLVPDATGSEHWLREIEGSIEESAIWSHGKKRVREWQTAGEAHWMDTRPDLYERIFGPVAARRRQMT